MLSSLCCEVFTFELQNINFSFNMSLTCIVTPGLDIIFSYICPRPVFFRKRRGFTSRKLYVCLETFLCFLHQFDWAYVSRTRCVGFFVLCSFWFHMIQMYSCLREKLLIVLRAAYSIPKPVGKRRGSLKKFIKALSSFLVLVLPRFFLSLDLY